VERQLGLELLDARQTRALSSLALRLVGTTRPEEVDELSVEAIAAATGASRVALIESHPDGTIVVRAAVGLGGGWPHVSSSELTSKVPGSYRRFADGNDWGDGMDVGPHLVFRAGVTQAAETAWWLDLDGVEGDAPEQLLEAVANVAHLAWSRAALSSELASRWSLLIGREQGPRRDELADDPTRYFASPGRLLARLVRAVEDERSRMASEIHDGPVQRMSGLILRVETARHLLASDRAGDVDHLLATVKDGLVAEVGALRRFMVDLRPPMLDKWGLSEAISHLGRRFEGETGVRFRFGGCEPRRLAASQELVVFRILQEALMNVAKHADARMVKVTLDIESGDSVTLVISDDGVGFDPESVDYRLAGHFGLVAMRERAEMAGGHFELRSAPGEGTTISVRLDVDNESSPLERAIDETRGALAG
jgi:signal transduction histidine kinase